MIPRPKASLSDACAGNQTTSPREHVQSFGKSLSEGHAANGYDSEISQAVQDIVTPKSDTSSQKRSRPRPQVMEELGQDQVDSSVEQCPAVNACGFLSMLSPSRISQ